MSRFRLFLAVLIAPLVLPLAVLALNTIRLNSSGETLTTFIVLLPICYLVAGFLALPIMIVLRAFELVHMGALIVVGGSLGLVTGTLVYFVFFSEAHSEGWLSLFGYLLFWTVMFALSALTFWLIRYGFTLRPGGETQQIVGREPRERVSHEAFVNQG